MKTERTSVVAVSSRRREKSQNHFSCLMTHDKVNQHHARKAELLYILHVSLSQTFSFGKIFFPFAVSVVHSLKSGYLLLLLVGKASKYTKATEKDPVICNNFYVEDIRAGTTRSRMP